MGHGQAHARCRACGGWPDDHPLQWRPPARVAAFNHKGRPYFPRGCAAFISAGRIDNCEIAWNNGCSGTGATVTGGTLANCRIHDNTGSYIGSRERDGSVQPGETNAYTYGTVYITGGTVTDCTIVSNRAATAAGAYLFRGGTLTNSIVADNVATMDYLGLADDMNPKVMPTPGRRTGVGGVLVYGSSARVVDCTITNNTAEWFGSGQGVTLLSGTVEKCRLAANGEAGGTAADFVAIGGTSGELAIIPRVAAGPTVTYAAPHDGTEGVVTNCLIANNFKKAYGSADTGGGIRLYCGTVTDSVISNNIASNVGGIYVGESDAIVDRCIIEGNRASAYEANAGGAGVYISAGRVSNSLIIGNRVPLTKATKKHGAGVQMSGGEWINCTVVSNTQATVAMTAGVHNNGGAVRNCIVWENGTDNGATNLTLVSGSVTYSCYPDAAVEPEPEHHNVIVAEPGFRKSALPWRLAQRSPCVNAGAPDDWTADDLDLAGATRVFRKVVDIGAYEQTSTPALCIMVR